MEFAYSPTAGNATFPTWSESFSAPSVAPLTRSPSSTGGGFDWMGLGQGIALAGEGIGNAFRAFRGEPPIPGGMTQQYWDRIRDEQNMQQLKELFGSLGMYKPTLYSPEDSEDEKENGEESEGKEDSTGMFRMPVDTRGFDFKRTSDTFDSDPGSWGSPGPFPSPRLAGQALSGYFNTGN